VISLDSMVNIAFPAMAATFGVSAPAMRWVIVCYVLSYAFLSFAGGALGDRIGYRPVFVVGMAGSAVAYVVAAAAPTFGWLLAGRVMQGLAGGLVYGTAPAIVTAGADRTGRTRALGFLNGALGLAFAIGPIVAGLLIATVGWRAVFSARAPLALIALVAALRGLRRDGPGALRGPVSVRDVLRRPVRRGLGPMVGGLMFTLTPLGMALGAPLAPRLAERLGTRLTVVAGLLVEALGLAALGTAGATTPFAAVAAELFAAGLGLGVFVVPNMAALMEEFKPHQQGAAGGFAFLARTLGIVAGVLTWAQIFELARGALGFDVAFERALLTAGATVLVAALLAMVRRSG